jgi:hypothetical protein
LVLLIFDEHARSDEWWRRTMIFMAFEVPAPARVIAAFVLIVAGAVTAGLATLTVPAWRAAHGEGVVGTFTLKEPLSCDRLEPPQQRCGWFGDFVSDDGTVERRRMELHGGLPRGAKIGDTLRARDAGSRTQIYPESGETVSWKPYALALAITSLVAIVSFVIVQPWSWITSARRRRKQRAVGSKR